MDIQAPVAPGHHYIIGATSQAVTIIVSVCPIDIMTTAFQRVTPRRIFGFMTGSADQTRPEHHGTQQSNPHDQTRSQRYSKCRAPAPLQN
jgi:hypothetical protein